MPVYVCAESALQHYRCANPPAEESDAPIGHARLKDAVSSLRDTSLVSLAGLCIPEPTADNPLHVLVPQAKDRGRSKRVSPSVWATFIPKRSFRKVGTDLYVSSPEFLFLQMARKLELVPLIELGMELCGTYRRDALDGLTLFDRPILTTPSRISRFLDTIGSAPGAKRARAAIKFVAPNSASPLETIVYLLLCLPCRLGGYGFPQPKLNANIKLSKRGQEYTLRKRSVPDLYWASAKIDLECHGKMHELETRRQEDSMRRKALEHMGVNVVELTYEEVRNPDLFFASVKRLAKSLGVRIRSRNERHFAEHEAQLRSTLFPSTLRDDQLWRGALSTSDTDTPFDTWDGEELPPEFESWEVYMADGGTPEL